jgi:transposase
VRTSTAEPRVGAAELREITEEDGRRLLRIVLRGGGSVVAWRRAQIVSLSAQRMPAAQIGEAVAADSATVRDVIASFNRDGFDSLDPRRPGVRSRSLGAATREEIRRIAMSDPRELELPFAAWSLPRLADYLVGEGVVGDISYDELRELRVGS